MQCSSATLIWKNMDSISHMKATCSRLHLTGTLEGKLSGPDFRSQFNDQQLNLELQSKKILIFSLLTLMWYMPAFFFLLKLQQTFAYNLLAASLQ